MKRFCVLMCGMAFFVNAYSQSDSVSIGTKDTIVSSVDNSKYFYKVTTKEFHKLKKEEVAFVYKGVEYRIQGSAMYKKWTDKKKLRKLEPGEIQDMMSGVPSVAKLFNAGSFVAISASQTTGVVGAIVGNSMMKNAMQDFYNQFLSLLPEENAQYALNYQPQPFIRLTDSKASSVGWERVAFTYDGADYFTKGKYIYKKSDGFHGFIYKKRGIRPLGKLECTDLMGNVYGKRWLKGYRLQMAGAFAILWCLPAVFPMMTGGKNMQKRALNEFYANMNTSDFALRQASVEKSVEEPSKDTSLSQSSVIEQPGTIEKPQLAVAQDTVDQPSRPTRIVSVDQAKDVPTVAQTEPMVKNEVKQKQKRVRPIKLNERKRNGYGIFLDAGGCLLDGPRLGMEMRFNRCIPSVFAGYPNAGAQFVKDHKNLSDMQSVFAGVGIKGLVPAGWGGFYAGGSLIYGRYSGTVDKSTVYEQKRLDNDASALANIGFRFQTKCNLFFNVGGMVGPTFVFGSSRYSNPLLYDYSPKYQSEDMKILLRKMVELSIGYEF